jgi:hypothetical protein
MPMRITVALAVMLLGVTAANAFDRTTPISPFDDYECVPIKRIGQNDPDPVYKIEINLAGDDKGVLSSMDVFHTTVSGKTYNRTTQFVVDATLTQVAGHLEYRWSGTRSNPAYSMVGVMAKPEGKAWQYSETFYNRGKQTYAMLSVCHRTGSR